MGWAGPNHYFIPETQMPYKWELGGASHEGCAGLLALKPYLGFLAGGVYEGRQTVVDAFSVAQALESDPYGMLLDYLQSQPNIRMIGAHSLSGASVPTVAFLHNSKPSSVVAREVNAHGIGIRNGNMYAVRLCENLGIDPSGRRGAYQLGPLQLARRDSETDWRASEHLVSR